MAALEKTIKLTQAQYDTLAAGGTVGSYTGLNENYIYLVEDNDGYVLYSGAQSLTTAQKTQARTNIAAADADSLAKLYYNLGHYDTKSGNTITRRTGYIHFNPEDLTQHTNNFGLKYYTINIGAGKTLTTNIPSLGYSWANVWNVQSYGKTWEYNSTDGNISLLFDNANINESDVLNMGIMYKLSASSTEAADPSYYPVSTVAQSFAGEKTFKSNVNIEGALSLKGTSEIYNSVGGSTLLWTGTSHETVQIEANSMHRLYFFDGGSYTFVAGNLYAIFCTYAGTTVYIKAYNSAGGVVWSEAINSCGMVLFQYMSWGAYLWKSGAATNIKSMTNVSSIKVECGGGNRTTVYRVREAG